MILPNLQGIPIGVVPKASGPSPTVLVAIMGPYPFPYGDEGRTTLDDTLEMCAYSNATPVFIPDLISDEEKASTESGMRLRGHTEMRNLGIKMGRKGGYDYVFLLENDAKCPPDTLERLIAHNVPIIAPRLTYPEMPVVEMICFGPQPTSQQKGLHKLTWAAHTANLFNCKALDIFRTSRRVFMGFGGEGGDHQHWQKHGLNTWMDLAAPIEVIELARGHLGMLQIPFRNHVRADKSPCPGPLYEWKRTKNVAIYRCGGENCVYELIFQPPWTSGFRHPLAHPVVRGLLALERDVWAERAGGYKKLSWALDKGYLDTVIRAGQPVITDIVLDAGTGPGYIANKISPLAGCVVGMDISPDMMNGAHEVATANQEFIEGDIRAIPYPMGYFDKVYARMVFHGLVEEGDMRKAARECYRVLRDGGRFVLSEGVPSSKAIKPWYTEVFKLKEERITFTTQSLKGILQTAGFKDIEVVPHIIEQSSVKNWMEHSGLHVDRQAEITQAFRAMPEAVKRGYGATMTEEDVFINIKFVTVVGVK